MPEIGTIKADRPPRVILTSNRTREVHDALKRRCLYHWIDYPSAQKEFEIVLGPRAGGAGAARPRGRRLRPPPPRGRPHEGARDRRDARLGGGAAVASASRELTARGRRRDARRRPQVRGGHPAGPRRRRPRATSPRPAPPPEARLEMTHAAHPRSRDRPRAVGATRSTGGGSSPKSVGFGRALRGGGPARSDLGAAVDFARALTLVDIGERDTVRAAGPGGLRPAPRRPRGLRPGLRPMVAPARPEAPARRRPGDVASDDGVPPETATRTPRPSPDDERRSATRGSDRRDRRCRCRAATSRSTRPRSTAIIAAPDAYSRSRGAPPPRLRPDDAGRAARRRAARRPARAAPRAAPDPPLRAPPPRPAARAAGDAPAEPRDRRPVHRVGLAPADEAAAPDRRPVRHLGLDGAPLAAAPAVRPGAVGGVVASRPSRSCSGRG